MRRDKCLSHSSMYEQFVFPEKEVVHYHEVDGIIMKLPKPHKNLCIKRLRRQINFHCANLV